MLCALIALPPVAGCESGWHYMWSVDNHSSQPLRAVTRFDVARGGADTVVIVPNASHTIFEEDRMNGGPRPNCPFELRLFRGDSLIFRQKRAEANVIWTGTIKRRSWIFLSFDDDIRLDVTDAGLPPPDSTLMN